MGANKVLVYMYVVTLVGLASSVVLLGEGLGPGKLAGAAVILLGVYLARRVRASRSRVASESLPTNAPSGERATRHTARCCGLGQEGVRAVGREVYDQDHADDEEHEKAPGVQNVSQANYGTEGQPGAQYRDQEGRVRPRHDRGHHGEEQPRENPRLRGRTEPVAGT
jgi:hypothetical protein